MDNELERTSKGAVVAEEWNYPSIFSDRPTKTTKSSVSAIITTEHFPNSSQQRYRWANQLCFYASIELQKGNNEY
jgi:hypothetical protein